MRGEEDQRSAFQRQPQFDHDVLQVALVTGRIRFRDVVNEIEQGRPFIVERRGDRQLLRRLESETFTDVLKPVVSRQRRRRQNSSSQTVKQSILEKRTNVQRRRME